MKRTLSRKLFQRVEKLTLYLHAVDTVVVETLSPHISGVKELSMSGTAVGDTILPLVPPQLEKLSLTGGIVFPFGKVVLNKLTHISFAEERVHEGKEVCDIFNNSLVGIKSLKFLQTKVFNLDWESLLSVHGNKLEELVLTSTISKQEFVEEDTLKAISKYCKNLKELCVHFGRFGNLTLMDLCDNSRKIESLTLQECTSTTFACISQLKKLKFLRLNQSNISESDLTEILSSLKNLEILHLAVFKFEEAHIELISSMQNLKSVMVPTSFMEHPSLKKNGVRVIGQFVN